MILNNIIYSSYLIHHDEAVSTPVRHAHSQSSHHQTIQQTTTQTWPFVEIYAHKRYFYLEAQSFCIDGHPEIFLWIWFLGEFE